MAEHPAEFAHLRRLADCKPASKAKIIRLLWPEIEAALAAGHTLKEVAEQLGKDGLVIGYSKLRTYISQLRKESPSTSGRAMRQPAPPLARETPKPDNPVVAAIQEQRIRKEQREFRHNPSPSEEDLV